MGGLRITRVYDPPQPADGFRVLVDRIWPRGVTHERAAVDEWLKEVAPSSQLRTWYGHDPARFLEFAERYRNELESNPALERLRTLLAENDTVTLVYSAKDHRLNQATVLRNYLQPPREEPSGDAACRLDEVCPECGAITEQREGPACWRCGSTSKTGETP